MHTSTVNPAPGPAATVDPATTHNPPESSKRFCGHQVSAAQELRKFDDPDHMPLKVQIFSRNLLDGEREYGTILKARLQFPRWTRRWRITDTEIKPNMLRNNLVAEGSIREFFERGLGQILECHGDSPNSGSERFRSYINLPKDPADYVWRKELGPHSNEDALIEIFGENNAQHLRDQLNRMQANNPDDERVKQWIEICDMLRENRTCSFPYYATRLCSGTYYVSPEAGWRSPNGYKENVILELLFHKVDRRSIETINDQRNKFLNFLKSEGVTGNILWGRVAHPWDSPPPLTRDCLTLDQVFIKELQIFLRTTQVQQLSEALWQFVEQSRDAADPPPELNPDFVPRKGFPDRR
ncbi:hypothetical protein ACTL6P_17725 [Endozoicomonas acroporae]|uniref:hypothetical protein n=1 Tax=Endozoicomonas acroporae TaxID=1701104 RepID=UPI000C76EE32|nr:hypothetical protein [Endozoicomonas acroporae]